MTLRYSSPGKLTQSLASRAPKRQGHQNQGSQRNRQSQGEPRAESEALWLDAASCQNARRPKQPSVPCPALPCPGGGRELFPSFFVFLPHLGQATGEGIVGGWVGRQGDKQATPEKSSFSRMSFLYCPPRKEPAVEGINTVGFKMQGAQPPAREGGGCL